MDGNEDTNFTYIPSGPMAFNDASIGALVRSNTAVPVKCAIEEGMHLSIAAFFRMPLCWAVGVCVCFVGQAARADLWVTAYYPGW